MPSTTSFQCIDPRLVERIGPVSAAVESAIDAEVHDALTQVVGHLVDVSIPPATVAESIAPWAYDLGRGLHWHDRCGNATTTAELTAVLAPSVAGTDIEVGLGRDVDIAWALFHGRYAEQIFGAGAVHRPSARLRSHCPWFDAAVLGFRIDLVLEYHRLHEATR